MNSPIHNNKNLNHNNKKQNNDFQQDLTSGAYTILKHDSSHSEEEHEEHVDERWLVSYADMMTLLFGLFVMLYSMSTQFEKVQESIKQQFSNETQDPLAEPKNQNITPDVVAKLADYEKMKIELDKTNLQLKEVQKEKIEKTEKIDQLEQVLEQKEKLINKISQKTKPDKNNNEDILKEDLKKEKLIKELKASLSKAKDENESLQKKVADEKTLLESIKNQSNEDLKKKSHESSAQIDNIKNEQQKLLDQSEKLEAKNKDLLDQIKEDEKKISQMIVPAPYTAFMINWSTPDHDIDMVVTDPQGKVFNFKDRKFSDHPGQFVLDSRRGPGAEMWQTDKIIPGVYKVKITFYNSYGNPEPANITTTVYTAQGITQLPVTTLDFTKSKTKTFNIKISAKGEIQIL